MAKTNPTGAPSPPDDHDQAGVEIGRDRLIVEIGMINENLMNELANYRLEFGFPFFGQSVDQFHFILFEIDFSAVIAVTKHRRLQQNEVD